MKCTSRMVVLAGLAILAVAMLHLGNPLQHWANLPTECRHASQMLADGGAPMPPWPTGNALVADGGARRASRHRLASHTLYAGTIYCHALYFPPPQIKGEQ